MEFLTAAWPWYVAGPLIALTFFLLHWFGRTFGVSNNLRTMCAMGGGGRCSSFFQLDVKEHLWNLILIVGSGVGGFLAYRYLMEAPAQVDIAASSIETFKEWGIADPGKGYIPEGVLGNESLASWFGRGILLAGGFLVGFGARYAGGCTSGHAITGLSTLQMPSLIAVIGFFVGGLLMTYFILPWLLAG